MDLTGINVPSSYQNSRQIPASPEFRACRLGFCLRSSTPLPNRGPVRNRASAVLAASLPNRCWGRGRSPRFERILSPAAPAFQMAQDTVDHAGICNKGDDGHARPAAAQEGIRLENFLIKRAHVLRASLEKSESSCRGGGALPIG